MVRRIRYKNVPEDINNIKKYIKKNNPTDTIYQVGPMTVVNPRNKHYWTNTISQFK